MRVSELWQKPDERRLDRLCVPAGHTGSSEAFMLLQQPVKKQTKHMLMKKKKQKSCGDWLVRPNRSKASITVLTCKYADVITFVDCGLRREGLCVCVNMLCVCGLCVNIDERPVSPDAWVGVSEWHCSRTISSTEKLLKFFKTCFSLRQI